MATMGHLQIAIAGVGGRMGRALLDAAGSMPNARVCAVLEHAASLLLGQNKCPQNWRQIPELK